MVAVVVGATRNYLDPGVAEWAERTIDPPEFDRRVAALTEEEISQNVALIEWFMRRYSG